MKHKYYSTNVSTCFFSRMKSSAERKCNTSNAERYRTVESIKREGNNYVSLTDFIQFIDTNFACRKDASLIYFFFFFFIILFSLCFLFLKIHVIFLRKNYITFYKRSFLFSNFCFTFSLPTNKSKFYCC